MGVGGVDDGQVLEARATIDGLEGIGGRDGIAAVRGVVGGSGVGAHEGIGQGAVGIAVGSGADAIAEVKRLSDGNAILAVVDASAVSEDVDVGAFGAEFAVALCFVSPTSALSSTSMFYPRHPYVFLIRCTLSCGVVM